jgi:hypothetical protein
MVIIKENKILLPTWKWVQQERGKGLAEEEQEVIHGPDQNSWKDTNYYEIDRKKPN